MAEDRRQLFLYQENCCKSIVLYLPLSPSIFIYLHFAFLSKRRDGGADGGYQHWRQDGEE